MPAASRRPSPARLGRRYGLKLHLIGASPLPQIDPAWRNLSAAELSQLKTKVCEAAVARREVPLPAWQRVEKALEIERNLRAFAADGVQVTYHACDLADRARVAETLARIRAADGSDQRHSARGGRGKIVLVPEEDASWSSRRSPPRSTERQPSWS